MSIRGFRSLLSVLNAGFEPAGVVMGASALQIVRPTSCRLTTRRLGTEPVIFPTYEDALRQSWRAAVEKLEAEAVQVGAHGVVGVSVVQSAGAGLESMKVVRLTGSAVRVPGADPLERPFLSLLSMDETLKLLLRGWVPRSIVCGISAIHVHGWASSPFRQRTAFSNAELVAPTEGMQLARLRAEHEVRTALGVVDAHGSVGSTVGITRVPQTCGRNQGVLIEARIIGTAVVHYGPPTARVNAVRELSHVNAR